MFPAGLLGLLELFVTGADVLGDDDDVKVIPGADAGKPLRPQREHCVENLQFRCVIHTYSAAYIRVYIYIYS